MPMTTKNFSDIITFTRTGSTATYFNSAGVLTTTVADEPRFDYNPSTLAARGFLIEEARANSIRNNTMQGAVAGTPGTLPQVSGSPTWSTNIGTLTREVVAVSTINGISYIDIRLSGTTSTTQGTITFEISTGVAASNGQAWTESAFLSIVAGTLTNISVISFNADMRDSGGVYLAGINGVDIKGSLSETLNRYSQTLTTTNASTAFFQPYLRISWTNGAAIDITLRIGLPQLELGAFATSVIPTTTTALTRNADVASVNTLSPWFNSQASTLYAEFVWEGLKSTSGQAYAQFDDGSTNNRIVAAAGSSNANIMTTTSGGTSDGSVATPATVFAANTIYKTALALAANDLQSFVNGTAGTADTTVTLPVGLTNFKLGASLSVTANVWLRRVTYYPRRLSQAEGISITA